MHGGSSSSLGVFSLAFLLSPWVAACASSAPACPTVIAKSDCASSHGAVSAQASATEPAGIPPRAAASFTDLHRSAIQRILDEAQSHDAAYARLRELTDGVGHRLSGSPALDRAITWAQASLRADGHENVRAEKVMVPHWDRGVESAEIVGEARHALAILGIGGTVGTPKTGVTADVVVVSSFEELEAKGAAVKDKIVLFNAKMAPHDDEKGSDYGKVVPYRSSGATRAAKLGAKAVLIRSLATASLRTPHTGAMKYEDGAPKIPAASVSTEDADLIARLAQGKAPVVVKLTLGARTLPDAPSANVIAELRGREKPEEIVLIGAHLDSWDVGQGAHDDGAGCVIVMQALTTLRRLGLTPRRTVRVVLFTNEENGLKGAFGYAKEHAAEIPRHVAALEADFGGFAPDGFAVEVPKDRADLALGTMREIAAALAPLGKLKVEPHFSGADIIPLVKAGTPGIGFMTKGTRYFDLHHSAADTLDKVDPKELAASVAAVTVVAYLLAEAPFELGKPAP